jgi:hypothetical protein
VRQCFAAVNSSTAWAQSPCLSLAARFTGQPYFVLARTPSPVFSSTWSVATCCGPVVSPARFPASRSKLCQSGRLATSCPWLGTGRVHSERAFVLCPVPKIVQSDRVKNRARSSMRTGRVEGHDTFSDFWSSLFMTLANSMRDTVARGVVPAVANRISDSMGLHSNEIPANCGAD